MSQQAVVQDLGAALGLFDGDGELDSGWLSEPLERLQSILTNDEQRAALGRFLDEVVPGPAASREGHHPLLWTGEPAQAPRFGNLYLVLESDEIAVAGEFHTDGGEPFSLALSLRVPLFTVSGGDLTPAFEAGGTIDVGLRLELPPGTGDVALDAVSVTVAIAPVDPVFVTPRVALEGFRLGAAAPRDLELDGSDFAGSALEMVLGLLHDALANAPEPFRSHLLPVLGLDPALPLLPLLEIANDADALRRWLAALANQGELATWWSHLGQLLGGSPASGAGTQADPWRASLITGDVDVALTLAVAQGKLRPGVSVRAGSSSSLHGSAELVLLGLPLAGALAVDLLPAASVTLRSPAPLLPAVAGPGGTTLASCHQARAGFALVGGQPTPVVELVDVTVAGQHHARIDLTNLDEIGDLASGAIEALLLAALGDGPGRHLLALVGVVGPTSTDPPWNAADPPRLDFVRFVTDPLGAVAAFYREVLVADGLSGLLAELGALLTIGSPPGGAGTFEDPWGLTIASASPISVELVAWKDGDVTLHIGLAIELAGGALRFALTTELLRATITSAGHTDAALLPELYGTLALAPVPTAALAGDVQIAASALSLGASWALGHAPTARASASGVSLEIDGDTLGPFDVTYPLTTTPDAALLRAVAYLAATRWFGPLGGWLFAVAGGTRGHLGLPADFPVLDLTHPIAGLRAWVGDVATGVSAEGTRFIEPYLKLLASGAMGHLPATFTQPWLEGDGSAEEPWRVGLDPLRDVELLVWLDPDDTIGLAAALADAGTSADALAQAVMLMRAHHDGLRNAVDPTERARLSSGITTLEELFETSDGVVPLVSQAPTWTTEGPLVEADHASAPVAAATQIRSAIGGVPAVLLSAPFHEASVWSGVIAGDPHRAFDLRDPTITPDVVDLRHVTDVVPFYTADLAGTDLDALTMQIGRVLEQLDVVQPGVPVVLVAHSLTGVAAVRAAAAHSHRVSKVVAVASPLLGAMPPYWAEAPAGVALTVARALAEHLPARTRAAVAVAGAALDGLPPGTVARCVAAMADVGELSAPAGIEVVAIRAVVGAGFRTALAAASNAVAPGETAPSRMHAAVCANLDARPPTGELSVRTSVRLYLGAVGLGDGALDATSSRLDVVLDLARRDRWLLGGAGLREDGTPWSAKLRRARIVASYDGDVLTTTGTLVDAGLDATTGTRTLALDAPEAPVLLNAAFASIAAESAGTKLIDALTALGIWAASTGQIAADALAALQADGKSYLGPRLVAALASDFYGHSPADGLAVGPLQLRLFGSDIEVAIDHRICQGSVTISSDGLAVRGSVTARVAGARLRWRHDGNATLTGSLEPWVRDVPLWPSVGAVAELPRSVLMSAVVDALLRGVVPMAGSLPPLDALFEGRAEIAPGHLSLSPPALTLMLRNLSAALGHPSTEGLHLAPADLLITATATPAEKPRIGLRTVNPFGGVLGIDLGLVFTGGLAVEPAVSITLSVPDPPGPAGDAWRDVSLELGLDETGIGVALVVGTTRVTFLPQFSGWASLLAGGVALLPRALDEITTHVPSSPVKDAVLAVAGAFDLHGPDFASHTAEFQAIGSWSYDLTLRTQILDAVAQLLALTPLAASITHTPGTATLGWTSPALPSPVTGTLGVNLDWSGELPAIGVTSDLAIVLHSGASALERVALGLGFEALLSDVGHAVASIGLDRPLGMAVEPRLEIGVVHGAGGAEPVLRLLPLAAADDGPVIVALLPEPEATVDESALPGALGFGVVLPLVSALIERATGTTALWPGGPSAVDLVDASGLFDSERRLVTPAPDVPTVLGNVAAAMSVEVPIDELTLALGSVGSDRIGFALGGSVPIPIDDVELEILFGEPAGPDALKTEVTLFRKSGDRWVLAPGVSANHFGVGVNGAQGKPLLDTDSVRIGGLSGYTFFDIDVVDSNVDAEFRGVGLSVVDLGVSLGSATGGDNPIASGIMQSASTGDAPPPQPSFGIAIEYARGGESEEGAEGDFELRLKLLGDDETRVWIGVRAAFGPLYIDQIGIEIEKVVDPAWLALLIDGGVTVSGFSAQVDDLAIRVPLKDIDKPGNWGVDLAGLGIAYNEGGLSILGGLVKREITGGVEYAGMLQLRVSNIGAVAVGAWAQTDEFDSLFIFAAVFLTISFPPYFELQALGAGFGYNRALVVPDDMNAIPSFPLVNVLDDPSAVEQPMQLLESLRSGMPARKGTFWFAAGLRGALFTVVDVVAVLYVAIDRGFEIGLLGVGRLAQPKASPIVSIELAVKVRYSSAEGLLSIQAQLTDNSWLLMRDCQLTGGFALFIWFNTGKFVLTIGGYHPAFEPEPEFPIVPRLGFRCDIFGALVIKGESYFALTNSCVMAGVRLEAAYDIGWLKAWFRAWADFLLSWDPFHYDISIGVELGVDFNIVIDLLFGKIRIHFSFSIGASLHIVGPPLHGELTANLGPISITVPFGNDKPPKPPLLTWQQFRDRYIYADDPNAIPVSAQADEGMVPPPSGDDPPQGLTASDPIRLVPEFAFVTTTAMPASEVTDPLGAAVAVDGDPEIDLGPMGEIDVASVHRLRIKKANGAAVTLDPDRFETIVTRGGFAEAVWRYRDNPEAGTENIWAAAGLRVIARSEALNRSAQVPIMTLVDVGRAHPLPFAAHGNAWRAETVDVGLVARLYGQRWTVAEAVRLLSEDSPARPDFTIAKGRRTTGTSRRALRRRRSPPLVAALSEGMDLERPNRGVPEAKAPVKRRSVKPRVLTLEQAVIVPTTAEAAAVRTTVSNAPQLLRMAPPRRSSQARALSKLVTVPTGRPSTTAAVKARSLPRGKKAQRLVATIVERVRTEGVELPAGAHQRWQIPAGEWTLALGGDAYRVVALGRGGVPLLDDEGVGRRRIALPPRTEQLVVWSLGRARSKGRGFGAISIHESPRPITAVGWHTESRLHTIGNLGALGRGCRVRLSVPLLRARKTLGAAPQEIVRAGRLIEEQSTVQTTLPPVTTLLVAGSVLATGDDVDDDLAVGVTGAEVGEPLLLDGAHGQIALYPVEADGPIAVTVSSLDAVRVDGVIGLMGTPAQHAARLARTAIDALVPDGPLSMGGSITLQLKGKAS